MIECPIDESNGVWIGNDIAHYYDQSLSQSICDYLISKKIKTVYEFGCGNGLYSKKMLEHGLDVDSSDGNPDTPELTQGLSYTLDISKKLNLPKRDAVVCLEVGEHIPEKFENTVITNLCYSSNNIIVLSWAIEGQGGHGHFNCRNNDYIINKMYVNNFLFDEKTSHQLRKTSDAWFRKTLMIFEKIVK